jgi:hypothetical protein
VVRTRLGAGAACGRAAEHSNADKVKQRSIIISRLSVSREFPPSQWPRRIAGFVIRNSEPCWRETNQRNTLTARSPPFPIPKRPARFPFPFAAGAGDPIAWDIDPSAPSGASSGLRSHAVRRPIQSLGGR